jgi:hypothetical protein
VILLRRQGSADPLVKIETPRGPTPFLSGHRCRSRASTRAFFAVVFDHSLRVTARLYLLVVRSSQDNCLISNEACNARSSQASGRRSSWIGSPMPNLPGVMLRASFRVVAWMLMALSWGRHGHSRRC